MSSKHSIFSASSAYRWVNCTGSIELCNRIKTDTPSKYAEEGTKAHGLAEAMIKNLPYQVEDYSDEMLNHVNMYVEYLKRQSLNGKLSIEQKFKLDFIDPRCFGTNDACITHDDSIEIVDLKYGMSAVSPENNMQLIYYALGALYSPTLQDLDYSKNSIKLTIVQPRLPNPIKTWDVTYEILLTYAEMLKAKIKQIDNRDTELISGSHCHFCKAITICPKIREKNTQLAAITFGELTTDDRDKYVVKVLESKKLVLKLIEECEEYSLNKLLSGGSISGLTLQEGRKAREWKEGHEILLQEVYGDEIYEKKLLSPAQVEKKFKDKEKFLLVKDFIQTKNGTFKAVPTKEKGLTNE